MHRKDESTTSSVVLGRLRACCWEIGLYLSASHCFTVYRSLTGLWNSPHRTGRKRSVTGHGLKLHQTPALRRQAVSWVRHSLLHKHTYLQRAVYITGEMIENKVCFYLHWQKLYIYIQGLFYFGIFLKALYNIYIYCIFIINKIFYILYIYSYLSCITYFPLFYIFLLHYFIDFNV